MSTPLFRLEEEGHCKNRELCILNPISLIYDALLESRTAKYILDTAAHCELMITLCLPDLPFQFWFSVNDSQMCTPEQFQ